MSNLLLRKLTFKSIIGFGDYKDLTVQNLIDMNKHRELVQMYYNLEKIDYIDEVKAALHITGERVIEKPGKKHPNTGKFINEIKFEMMDENRGNIDKIHMMHKENQFNKKRKGAASVLNSLVQSNKSALRKNNQWK